MTRTKRLLLAPCLALGMTCIAVFALGFFVIGLAVLPSLGIAFGVMIATGLVCLIVFYLDGGNASHHLGSLRRFNR